MSDSGGLLPSDNAEIEAELLDRPIVSITDVAYTYGRLDALAVSERFQDVEFDLPNVTLEWVNSDISRSHLLAMSPDKKSNLFGEEDSLLMLNLVLSPDPDKSPRLHSQPTQIARIDWSRMIRHGYIYREKRGLVYDHSLSVHVNGKSSDDIGRYVESRFKKWPSVATSDDEIMEQDDEWIIKEIASIADDEQLLSAAVEAVAGRIEGLEESTWEGILSLNLWFDIGRGVNAPVGPFAPGLVPICNEASIANLRDQFASFSSADNPVGKGVDVVTGEETTVLGTSPERPLSYYHGKQQGAFDSFDSDRSVQNQTFSMTTAMAVSTGTSIMNSCRERIGGQSRSIRDYDVHYLPFVPLMDANDARTVYDMLSTAHRDNEPIATQLARSIETWAAPENLRFHQVLINTGVEANKDKVIAENLGANLMPVDNLASMHIMMLDECQLDLGQYDWIDMFNAEQSQVVPILVGEYLAETMSNPNRFARDFTTGANDPRVQAFASIVTGEPIAGYLLLEEYVERLTQEQRDMLGDSSRDWHIPYDTIAKQYVQCNALSHAGLIQGTPPYPITTMTNDTHDTDERANREPNNRDEKLERYLQTHTLLSAGADGDIAIRGSFLLGALVGRVSAFQQNEGVQSPISRRYTIDSLTRAGFRSVFADAAAKNDEYAFAHNDGRPINQRYVRRIRDIIADTDPKEWEATEDSIQAAYAAGLSYARDDIWKGQSKQQEQEETDDIAPRLEEDLEA